MRIKRFSNLWAMGLILFGSILIAFYVAKIFFPQFIVGVAETPSIVKFGTYIDTHKWAFYLVDGAISMAIGFVYCCACCQKSKLSCKGYLVILGFTVALYLISAFAPQYYVGLNFVFTLAMHFCVCYVENNVGRNTFISTVICVVIDAFSQILSMEIRDLTVLCASFNSATYFVLLIDLMIWRVLLYLFYNYKNN